MSPRNGTWRRCSGNVFCISPPSAKLSPLPSSTVVSARSHRHAGTHDPADDVDVREFKCADLGTNLQVEMSASMIVGVTSRRRRTSWTRPLVDERPAGAETPVATEAIGNEIPAGEEARWLARHRGQVRLGKSVVKAFVARASRVMTRLRRLRPKELKRCRCRARSRSGGNGDSPYQVRLMNSVLPGGLTQVDPELASTHRVHLART